MTQEKKKNPGGRPVKYTKEVIEKEADLLEKWIQKEGNTYLKRFALERGYDNKRLYEFAEVNTKFSRILKIVHEWQEVKLVEGGLSSVFNPGFTKFVLGNVCGWTEKQQVSGDAANPLALLLDKIDGTSKNLVEDE